MLHIRHTIIATAVISLTALSASTANAQYAPRGYGYGPSYYGGAYARYGGGYATPYAGSYYSYGADRSNPSLAPNGWDQDNPRDFQLQGK
jgi:hypothetical protein